jgi:hypothetical protein
MMSEITRTAIQAPLAVAMASEMSRSQFHSLAQDLLRDFNRITAENAALQQRLNAADQRSDDFAEMLALASVSIDYHAGMKGEDGEHLYHLLARIRALFPNHVEHPLAMVEQDHVVGTTEKVAQPFTEQFIEDHLGKMPDQLRDHTKMIAARNPEPDFSLIGIVHTPPVEHDEP